MKKKKLLSFFPSLLHTHNVLYKFIVIIRSEIKCVIDGIMHGFLHIISGGI